VGGSDAADGSDISDPYRPSSRYLARAAAPSLAWMHQLDLHQRAGCRPPLFYILPAIRMAQSIREEGNVL
jgi:hypothetical protein